MRPILRASAPALVIGLAIILRASMTTPVAAETTPDWSGTITVESWIGRTQVYSKTTERLVEWFGEDTSFTSTNWQESVDSNGEKVSTIDVANGVATADSRGKGSWSKTKSSYRIVRENGSDCHEYVWTSKNVGVKATALLEDASFLLFFPDRDRYYLRVGSSDDVAVWSGEDGSQPSGDACVTKPISQPEIDEILPPAEWEISLTANGKCDALELRGSKTIKGVLRAGDPLHAWYERGVARFVDRATEDHIEGFGRVKPPVTETKVSWNLSRADPGPDCGCWGGNSAFAGASEGILAMAPTRESWVLAC